jgi:hypothetical protein
VFVGYEFVELEWQTRAANVTAAEESHLRLQAQRVGELEQRQCRDEMDERRRAEELQERLPRQELQHRQWREELEQQLRILRPRLRKRRPRATSTSPTTG